MPRYKGTENSVEYKHEVVIDDVAYKNVFYLKADEIAQFTNIQENRKYFVREIGVESEKYDKVTINTTDITVEDKEEGSITLKNIAESPKAEVRNRSRVVFTNNCSAANSRELRITKQLPEGQISNDEDMFDIQVKLGGKPYIGAYNLVKQEKDANGESKWEYYDIQGGKVVKQTDTKNPCSVPPTNEGVISIPAGYTITVTKIMSDTTFTVEECEITNDEYVFDSIEGKEDTYKKDTVNTTSQKVAGQIKLNKNAEVTVTNRLKRQCSWELVKKSSTKGAESGQLILLSGAKFELVEVTKQNDVWTEVSGDNAKKYTGTSADTGIVAWVDASNSNVASIPQGTYRLTEKTSPAGYSLSSTQWLLEIAANGEVNISLLGSNGKEMVDSSDKPMEVNGKEENDPDGNTKIIFYFENDPVYALPSTGGKGIYWYSIGGTLLMMAGALILYRNKSKKVRGCRRA